MTAPRGIAAIIVMGVSGSGKSTVAAALAERLGYTYQDGDSLHPKSNIEKMRSGIALTDADRAPWLDAIAKLIDNAAARGTTLVVACSALKRAYRDILVHGRSDVEIVYLKGSRCLMASRLARRRDHFMPASLLDSQFATLEEPTPNESAVTADIDAAPDAIVDDIVRQLGLATKVAVP